MTKTAIKGLKIEDIARNGENSDKPLTVEFKLDSPPLKMWVELEMDCADNKEKEECFGFFYEGRRDSWAIIETVGGSFRAINTTAGGGGWTARAVATTGP